MGVRERERGGYVYYMGFSGGSDGKESTCNVGGLGLIPGLGRSPGEGNGSPLQYSCLENPMAVEAGRLSSVNLSNEAHSGLNIVYLCHTHLAEA